MTVTDDVVINQTRRLYRLQFIFIKIKFSKKLNDIDTN